MGYYIHNRIMMTEEGKISFSYDDLREDLEAWFEEIETSDKNEYAPWIQVSAHSEEDYDVKEIVLRISERHRWILFTIDVFFSEAIRNEYRTYVKDGKSYDVEYSFPEFDESLLK